jgi:cap2 methyltransferase
MVMVVSVESRFPHLSWDWVGCTLNPYFEGNNSVNNGGAMVEDDGFINETPEKWFFGQDNSGDMRLPQNISATWGRTAEMGQVLLVTADGSIDCSASPSEEEEVVAQLHYCEVVAAIGALAVGGAFVLKVCISLARSDLSIYAYLHQHTPLTHTHTHIHTHTDVYPF